MRADAGYRTGAAGRMDAAGSGVVMLAPMSMLTLAQAQEIARLAFEEGGKLSVTRMTVVVTDPGGPVRLALRGDGVGTFGTDIARAKCESALGFQRSTLSAGKIFSDPARVAALTAATGGRFLPLGGGVVVVDVDGEVLGAAAAAGSSPENDHQIITAAVAAAGFQTLD